MKFLLHLLLLFLLSALSGAAWVAHRAPELPELPPVKPEGRQRDLVDELKQSSIKAAGVLELSEADINRHLARVLTARTADALGSRASLESVRTRLQPGMARLYITWNVMGWRSTVALDLSVRRLEKVFRVEVQGGAYGRLQVPRGMLRPLAPAFRSLAEALRPEVLALFQMNQITLAQGRVLLDPRFP